MENSPEAFPIRGLYADRYELTMASAYWRDGRAEEPAVFDYFFRKLPFGNGSAVFAGAGTLLESLERFRFDDDQIEFLRQEGFAADFLEYLSRFRFRGSIRMPQEGEIVFPVEPIARVEGGLLEAQLVETLLLNILNIQTLIATKAARCRLAAKGRAISEFGMRRAQGMASRWASRAAYIGGCQSTSNMDAAEAYGVPSSGTMAHSFVQSYGDELTAFRKYADVHGASSVLLLDTYDTLRSGVPNAITVARELVARNQALAAVRLDSGDLAYLSKKVRAALDQAGFPGVKIVASNQLDEFVIRSLLEQGAPIDIFGVGTALATGMPDAALDGVYKLAHCGGKPRLKRSETLAKATLPARKAVARYRDEDGFFRADAIHLVDEPTPTRMIHPSEPLKQLDLGKWKSEPLLKQVIEDGRPIGAIPKPAAAAQFLRQREGSLPPEHLRFDNPHIYKVGISPGLAELRDNMLRQMLGTNS